MIYLAIYLIGMKPLLPFFVFAGVATLIVLASVSLGIPPLWAGLLAGSIGVYIAKTR